MNFEQNSILITGGGGMLAHAFKQVLPQAQFFSRASLDVCDEKAMGDIVNALRPKLVINCAAYTKVDKAEEEALLASQINGDGVYWLARACARTGAGLVHFSTDYVFDGTLRRPLRPDDPVGPTSAYGRSKLKGEILLKTSELTDWLVIRTAWLYGPGGPCFPQAILSAARAGKPLNVVDDQIGSPTFTFDLAKATLELLEHDATGIWHIVNDGQTSWHDFARAILDEFHIDAPLSRTTSAEWKQSRPTSATRPSYSVLDMTPFEKLTGHRTRPWRDALKDYAQIP